MSMDYSAIEKAINDTRADIKKFLEKDEYKMMAVSPEELEKLRNRIK